MKVTGTLVCSSMEWRKGWVGGGAGGCSLRSQNVHGLWLDDEKKLMPLMIELGVVLNHLWVIHLWQPQKMTNVMTFHSQKWTMDLLFKNKRIWRHVTNFKTTIHTSLSHVDIPVPCGCHECMVPYVFAVIWNFSILEKITILLFAQNKPIIKILLKDISKP